jgi:hypothetical protein
MATRANVIIRENGQDTFLYSHYDGYIIDGLGDMLEEFVIKMNKVSAAHTLKEIGEMLVDGRHPKQNCFEIQSTDCIHDDVEYIYIIEDGFRLTAYTRRNDEAWDNPTSEYTKYWNKVELV